MKAVLARAPFIAAAVFFFVAWALALHPSGIWNSPDEMANAFWTARVAQGESLQVRDVVVGIGAGAVHPRSIAVVGDALVPGSFPGLYLLYGTIVAILRFPLEAITPLLTALAGLAFGAIAGRLFGRRVGFWTILLFYLHPAVLYYSARGLFHNVLFVDLVIFAAGFLVLRPFKRFFGSREILDDVIAGFLLGWAVVTRASEAVWLLPACLAFLPLAGRDRWRRLLGVLAGAILPAFIFMQINSALFGSPFSTGYGGAPPSETMAAPTLSEAEGPVPGIIDRIGAFLPFGLHPRHMLSHGWQYGAAMFWWFTALGAVGLAFWAFAWKRTDPAQRLYLLVAALVAGWLVTLYGSWYLRDNLDPTRVTIGTSYVRYFLPAYVLALPWVAMGLLRIADAAGHLTPLLRSKGVTSATLLFAVAGLSLHVAVFSGDESLLSVKRTLEINAAKRPALLEAVPEDAVIMTERFDKLFFPDIVRFMPRTDEASFKAAESVALYAPIYWYGLEPSDEELHRLEDLAARHGFSFAYPYSPIIGETFFRLLPVAR